MEKLILFGFAFFSISLNAQINRVDHFFASSPKAEKLFKLFKEKLELPVAWEYQNWGSFEVVEFLWGMLLLNLFHLIL
jgi:hypothetical protein